jgi:hypothetical protein
MFKIQTVNRNMRSGSITVEAAFVMPIVILAVFAVIYLAFYLHDMCRIQAAMDKTLHKAAITIKHEADMETGEVAYENINDRGVFFLLYGGLEEEMIIEDYLQQELSEGLFLSKIISVSADVGLFSINASVKAETKVSLPGIKYLFAPSSTVEIKRDYPVHNPAETIRRTEVILDTGSSIKGVDELKEKLEDIFGS